MCKRYKHFINWLENKVDEHNNKLGYADQEEAWTVVDYIFSVIVHCILAPMLYVAIALHTQKYGVIIIGVAYAVEMAFWHVWHLFYY